METYNGLREGGFVPCTEKNKLHMGGEGSMETYTFDDRVCGDSSGVCWGAFETKNKTTLCKFHRAGGVMDSFAMKIKQT